MVPNLRRATCSCGVVLIVLLAGTPASARGQLAEAAEPAASTDLDVRREVVLFGIGAGLQSAFRLVPRPTRTVPASGLDPSRITWSVDRNVVGTQSFAADVASGQTRDASLAFLVLVAVATAGRDDTFGELLRRGAVYAETALISHGLTYLGKRTLARPRPFTYLPSSERPSGSPYDVSKGGVFESMPSGHASSAWTASTLGIMEHLLSRPRAGTAERVAVGLVGGGLAGATAALRVEAGQHFPSDGILSAGIGLLTGITIPLIHRGERPRPTRRAWVETWAGAAAGVLVGVLASRGY